MSTTPDIEKLMARAQAAQRSVGEHGRITLLPSEVIAMVNEILYLRASVRELLTVCEDWQVGESARMRAKALLDAARKAEGAQHG